jgi:tripartite ATP-independent transporter DctM subunit
VSDTSIGYLFLGGVVPGVLIALSLMVMNYIISRRRGFHADEVVPLREIPSLTVRAFPALMMPVVLLWGIYNGATTATEAAAVAAAYALLVSAFLYRSISLRDMRRVLIDSGKSAASVGLVIGGALILNYVVAAEQIPAAIASAIQGVDVAPLVFMLGVNLLLLVLGCVLDATTIILVILPLFIPTLVALGIDPVYFGVVAVVNCMIGLITPPYGILLFVINGTTGIPLGEIIREILPFLAALLISLLVMILFPDLILWLPRMFGYGT